MNPPQTTWVHPAGALNTPPLPQHFVPSGPRYGGNSTGANTGGGDRGLGSFLGGMMGRPNAVQQAPPPQKSGFSFGGLALGGAAGLAGGALLGNFFGGGGDSSSSK